MCSLHFHRVRLHASIHSIPPPHFRFIFTSKDLPLSHPTATIRRLELHSPSFFQRLSTMPGAPLPQSMDPTERSVFLSRRSEVALFVAFISFFVFAVVELLYAFISNSLALLGDAAAMIVDSCTYLGNFVAIKLTKKSGVSWLSIAGPFVSAVALTGVMIYVLQDAISELVASDNDNVRLSIVLIFGTANLLLDIINLILFYAFPEAYKAILTFTDPDVLEQDGGLNIRSALTHVLADTYRSIAVIVAALTAMYNSNVSSSNADAVAAIAVEVPIFAMCIQMMAAVTRRVLGSRNATVGDPNSLMPSMLENPHMFGDGNDSKTPAAHLA